MLDTDFLRTAVILTHVAAALLLAGAYVLMARVYPQQYLRWWALAWAGEATYSLSATLGFALRGIPGMLPASLAFTALGQWGAYVASSLIVLGAWAIWSGRVDLSHLARRLIVASLVLGVLATFAVPLTGADATELRFVARVAVPRAVSMAALLVAAWYVRRVATETRLSGYRWAWRALVGFAFFRAQYVFVGIVGTREIGSGAASAWFALLPLFETLAIAAIGITTALALVEDEARSARVAAEQRMEAERLAGRSVASLVSALSAIPDQVVVIDSDGRLRAWNAAFEEFLRRNAIGTAIDGTPFLELLPPERVADWDSQLPELLGGRQLAFESSYTPPGADAPAHFDVSARPIREGTALVGAVVVCRDVTARRALEARLQQTQRLDTVGRLAGGIAHDFNNLLTAILGSVSMARETIPPGHEAQSDLGDVQLAAERAAQLTRQLLAFARRHPVTQEAIDLNERVNLMERMLSRLVGPSVQLRTRLAEGLWAVRADPSQLEQVIVNLVVNARDAMPGGGSLSIRTENRRIEDDDQPSFFPRAVPPGDYVEIIVRDSGIGMDAATLAHAFEPFFTTKPVGQGTGLGLAMCYGIIRQQNGVIWIESEPGRGSTVHIMFPRWHGDVEARVEPVVLAPTPARAGHETILVVEDEPQVRAVASRTLRSAGYRVLEATNGRDGLQVARRERETIDLVLTDIVMPEMGGREMVELVRQFIPRTAVLYMSGFTAGGFPVSDEERESRHFLQKPFTPILLLEKIRQSLDDRAITSERAAPVSAQQA